MKPGQVKPEWLVYGAAASFVLMIGVLIQTFVYGGGSTGDSRQQRHLRTGRHSACSSR